MPDIKTPTPDKIAAAREQLCLSQSQCAMLIHVNLRTWQKYEGGESKMHPAFWQLFQIKSGLQKAPTK